MIPLLAPPSPVERLLSLERQSLLTQLLEKEVEEPLQKEQEKLQLQLDEPKLDHPPRERHATQTQSSSPLQVGGGKGAPSQPSDDRPLRKDKNQIDGISVPKCQTGIPRHGPGDGASKDHWKGLDRKDGKKDQDSGSAPEPKKSEENPAFKFSSANKYAVLSVDGEDENEGDDHTE
ncbi:Eukaryotic translation initiation factor 4B [Cricetulus griseus]|uniref:Eukaryotic translation initiation factor 4B n=1 Tax=Cricetulus griseus TaxID=10029 RepID=G3H9P0_CRIGR|nr:Eukaryotic translation initiation factor 4B [Cricetulus griseus]